MIAENLKYVNERIQKSCLKAGRDEKEVTLIAVSKTKPVPDLMEAYREGCREFGENKVQELVDKYEVMPKDIHWHMIGHLQTNKVKYIVDKVTMIHSVDSIKLAREISKEAQEDTEEIEVVLADRNEVKRILKEERVAIMCAYMLMHFLKDKEPFAFLEE